MVFTSLRFILIIKVVTIMKKKNNTLTLRGATGGGVYRKADLKDIFRKYVSRYIRNFYLKLLVYKTNLTLHYTFNTLLPENN